MARLELRVECATALACIPINRLIRQCLPGYLIKAWIALDAVLHTPALPRWKKCISTAGYWSSRCDPAIETLVYTAREDFLIHFSGSKGWRC